MQGNGYRQPAVVAAHMGARMHYALPVLLDKAGLLSQFFTDAYAGRGSWLKPIVNAVPESMQRPSIRRLRGRTSSLPPAKVTAFNMLGIRSSLSLLGGGKSATSVTDTYLRYARAFSDRVIVSNEMRTASMVYTKVKTVDITKYARAHQIHAVVEQNSTPLVARLPMWSAEMERWDGWQKSGVAYSDEAVWMEIEADEWRYADIVVAPSEYIRDSLISVGVAADKIRTIPYAIATERIRGRQRVYDGKRPLRLLFVGRIDLNKGTPYLLDALKKLDAGAVEAKVVGTIFLQPEKLRRYDDVADFTGRIPKQEVHNLYEWADLFILPSLSEGSATVTYEARAFGLPVIATPNSGAWLQPEVDGLEIPMQDVDGIVTAITRFLEEPDLVERMSVAALQNAAHFSWSAYQTRLVALVQEIHGYQAEHSLNNV